MGDALSRLGEVMRGLRLDPARMRRNLDLGGGLIMAEAVMLELGATIGRQHAHDVVYDAAQAAFVEGRPFSAVLAADPRVTKHLDAAASSGCSIPSPIPDSAPTWRAKPRRAREASPLDSSQRSGRDPRRCERSVQRVQCGRRSSGAPDRACDGGISSRGGQGSGCED